VAYDKLTGEERWRQIRDERTGWTTPVILDHQGRRQVVVNATNKVRSYDLETGELLWECGGQTANAIPTVVADEQHVYALSGYRGSTAMAIRLGQRGDLTDSDAIAWSLNRGTPYVPSPLLMSGRLWFTQGNDAVLSCVEASTGKVHYSQERLEGPSGFYASPVGVAGRVYLTGRDGTTVVIEDSESLKVLATNKLDDPMDASPALSGDAIYLRGHQYLYCIGK
jgi:outer membrane protein assembly factor BamB